MVKTVSKQCQISETVDTACRPLQHSVELHQKDLRIIPVLVYIWGLVLDPVLLSGHVSRLKSNRRVLAVRRVTLAPTCRYSSQTAV